MKNNNIYNYANDKFFRKTILLKQKNKKQQFKIIKTKVLIADSE